MIREDKNKGELIESKYQMQKTGGSNARFDLQVRIKYKDSWIS